MQSYYATMLNTKLATVFTYYRTSDLEKNNRKNKTKKDIFFHTP